MAKSDLKDKVVVITGASSGFGRGAAVEFAKAGANVVLAARRDQVLGSVAIDCEGAGVRALPVTVDVSVPSEVENLFQAAINEFGHIDVWVNNAGVGSIGRFDEIPLAEHQQVIATDLLGVLYGSYCAIRHFRERKSGVLINMASVAGKIPAPYHSSYAAAKAGVIGLSTAIREELDVNGDKDIHVCTIMPTSMDTPFFEHAGQHTGHEAAPIPPVYDPKEVVDTIVRLATDPRSEVTVGTAGKVFTASHNMARHATEAMMTRQTHKAEMEDAEMAGEDEGAVLEPMETGTGVTGGLR